MFQEVRRLNWPVIEQHVLSYFPLARVFIDNYMVKLPSYFCIRCQTVRNQNGRTLDMS